MVRFPVWLWGQRGRDFVCFKTWPQTRVEVNAFRKVNQFVLPAAERQYLREISSPLQKKQSPFLQEIWEIWWVSPLTTEFPRK